jgi:ceramide synthetase
MLGERTFKIVMNVLCVYSLYQIMLADDCDFLDTRVGGHTEHPLYFFNHPCQKLPSNLDSFYVFKLSYHCYELLHTSIFDRKRTDFPEYMLHHFLTFTLIFFSYVVNYLPVGAAVMVLHDVTDLCASIFKMVADITPFPIQICGYIIMVTSWVYFRMWFFPVHVIARIVEESQVWVGKTWNFNLVGMLTAFLAVLFLLHVFWFYLMLKGFIKRMKKTDYKE